MTDRELLQQVSDKVDALVPRVEAVEAAAAGSVSSDEVKAVADKETDLENRVGALETKFQTAPAPAPTDTAPDTSTVDSDSSTDSGDTSAPDAEPAQHTIT
jgi:BMFP domain-containing protein YqiC